MHVKYYVETHDQAFLDTLVSCQDQYWSAFQQMHPAKKSNIDIKVIIIKI